MNMFFHPLVLQPRLAFTDDQLGQGFQEYFVTAYEFRGILRGLWRNGWMLVDARKAAAGDVRVPVGRKPLVLSEDDVNYYQYFKGRGLAARLVLARDGEVLARTDGPNPHLTARDVVPMVDGFVARHPEFSVDGAKGVLALTGYEGLLGYHRLQQPEQRRQVRALVARLKATGWTFASHTYGHIDLTTDSLANVAQDTRRWKQLAVPLIGPTNMLIYPFGAPPTSAGLALLRRAGFTIQFDIDVRPTREHIDGYAFQAPQRMRQLFSVRRVMDPRRPCPLQT
jgi:hypothetical protein